MGMVLVTFTCPPDAGRARATRAAASGSGDDGGTPVAGALPGPTGISQGSGNWSLEMPIRKVPALGV